MDVPGLEQVLSDEGWPYASTLPVSGKDPGRFHALFGRDALIASLQVLPARPDVARATLRALARCQGRADDPVTLEEPGKIGHEFRAEPPGSFVAAGWPLPGPFAYYGSADATSWFLVLLHSLGDIGLVRELEVEGRRVAGWLAHALDVGGGLVRHAPGAGSGDLAQQGWRDARDPTSATGTGVLRRDGVPPSPPLADAETQAVTVAALRALAALTGDRSWDRRRAELVEAVTELFLPDVLMIDGAGDPIRSAGSQLGWLLWADAIAPAHVPDVAARLTEPDVLTPYGLRTLSSQEPNFRPTAYHRGAIWPFDSWLGWGGLRAAGRLDVAEQLRRGVLAAVGQLGGFPEVFAVDGSGRLGPIEIGNHHQAWTVGACWALTNSWDGRAW